MKKYLIRLASAALTIPASRDAAFDFRLHLCA
jgi:hypothetical protein